MARGLSFISGSLTTASQDMSAQQQYCLAVAQDAVEALAGMANAAGHPGLTVALNGATSKGNRSFTCMWAAYGQASEGLANSALIYADAEQDSTSAAGGINDDAISLLTGMA